MATLQLSILKIINLMVKRTSTSIKYQALFRNFIKPTMSLEVSFHILSQHHAILLLKHLLLALYKLIGVEIQSQLRSMGYVVDNSIVADNVDFSGDIFYVLQYLVSQAKSTFHCIIFLAEIS